MTTSTKSPAFSLLIHSRAHYPLQHHPLWVWHRMATCSAVVIWVFCLPYYPCALWEKSKSIYSITWCLVVEGYEKISAYSSSGWINPIFSTSPRISSTQVPQQLGGSHWTCFTMSVSFCWFCWNTWLWGTETKLSGLVIRIFNSLLTFFLVPHAFLGEMDRRDGGLRKKETQRYGNDRIWVH